MADQEGIETRLNNIRSVEPILEAMRTISMGSWQAALNRHHGLGRYSERLAGILAALAPRLGARRPIRSHARVETVETLVIGSERGLCGAFNSSLVQHADTVLHGYAASDWTVRLAALGSRVQRRHLRGIQGLGPDGAEVCPRGFNRLNYPGLLLG